MNQNNNERALPEEFRERMREFLAGEAEEFFCSYENPRAYGLRYNPLKFPSGEVFEQAVSQGAGWELSPVPWCAQGYYYQPDIQPGKHPWHEGGAYYIQEPSAMCAVELLEPKPGENICDLCAAPGGKTTQIAGKMQGQGLLVSNEVCGNRAKILSQNVERMGIANAVVLNESAEHLAQGFQEFFHRILVDAPCSGEGMFRKEPRAVQEWSTEHVKQCAQRQHDILNHAAEMLRPKGVLVYSTCTFSLEENEQCIQWFLDNHPEFTLEKSEIGERYFHSGKMEGAYRLWPHKLLGEGHFAARLRKDVSSDIQMTNKKLREDGFCRKGRERHKIEEALRQFREFQKTALCKEIEETLAGKYALFSEQLYLLPENMPGFQGWKTLRPGLHLGTCKKNRFEPSHALALYLRPQEVKQNVELWRQEASKYLHGETVSCQEEKKGWVLVCSGGLPLGWGKAVHGIVKNHYPKGLRIQY